MKAQKLIQPPDTAQKDLWLWNKWDAVSFLDEANVLLMREGEYNFLKVRLLVR